MHVALAPSHAELVFHVLAHVPCSAPSSLYDPAYVDWVAGYLGPAEARPLGQDVAVLAGQSHAGAIRLQRYARVFADPHVARAWTTSPLEDVPATALERVDQRDALLPSDDVLEVLRCAVALELDAWRHLPPVWAPPSLAHDLAPWGELAPRLLRMPLFGLRSLGARGRLWDDGIWIGLPDDRTRLEEVGWQAAHEATLAEVCDAEALDEDTAERVSVALLAARAECHGYETHVAHAAWVARYGARPSLTTREEELVRRLRSPT